MTLENGVFTWKTLSGEPYHTLALKKRLTVHRMYSLFF